MHSLPSQLANNIFQVISCCIVCFFFFIVHVVVLLVFCLCCMYGAHTSMRHAFALLERRLLPCPCMPNEEATLRFLHFFGISRSLVYQNASLVVLGCPQELHSQTRCKLERSMSIAARLLHVVNDAVVVGAQGHCSRAGRARQPQGSRHAMPRTTSSCGCQFLQMSHVTYLDSPCPVLECPSHRLAFMPRT
jgi:hypothetical protein